MTQRSGFWMAAVAGSAILMAAGGCPDTNDDTAVLAGRWELIPDQDTDPGQTFIEFRADGQVDTVEVIFDGGRVTTRALTASSDVIGDSVRVTTRLVAGRLVFEGELTEDLNEIVGETTVVLSLPGTVIELDGQPARLVRVD